MKKIDSKVETDKIVSFVQNILKKTGLKDIVIGWSGGIDSTVCLYLLAKALPKQNIHVLHMPYGTSYINELKSLRVKGLNIHDISIKKTVDTLWKTIEGNYRLDPPPESESGDGKVRLGNIMARVRMIMLFDFAKKVNGLVCGTENKTEHLLGYFTRYGDGASDIEPIQHLFKTQVFELAKYLGVPDLFIEKKPSANLWEGQTDEGEFGFTYEEADQVLAGFNIIDKEKMNRVKKRVKNNIFKGLVPYRLI